MNQMLTAKTLIFFGCKVLAAMQPVTSPLLQHYLQLPRNFVHFLFSLYLCVFYAICDIDLASALLAISQRNFLLVDATQSD